MNTEKYLIRATLLITILTLLSRIFGFVREAVIAYCFGATEITDAFLVAFTIPYIFYSVIGMALAAVIVPVFTEYDNRNRQGESWQALSVILNIVFVTTSIIAVIGVIGAPIISDLLGVGFSANTKQLTTNLIMMIMPSIIFMPMAGLVGGALNAKNVFGPPAVGPLLLNIAIIMFALVGTKWLGVYGLAMGTVTGALLFVLVQIPSLRKVGFKYYLTFSKTDPLVIRVLITMFPVLLASSIDQVYTLVDLRLGSSLTEGSIAALNYARKLMKLPQGLFVMAITTAIFPKLSKLITENKKSEMAITLQKSLKTIMLLAIPGSIGLIVLREPIVALLFERGAFDFKATIMTAEALLFYSLGLVGLCLYLPLTRGFFAMQDMKTPLVISVITILIKVALSIILVNYLQYAGLALATSIAILVNTLVLGYILMHRIPGLFNCSFIYYTGKVLLASLIMGLIVKFLEELMINYLALGSLTLIIRVALNITVGVVAFLMLCIVLRIGEMQYIIKILKKQFIKAPGK